MADLYRGFDKESLEREYSPSSCIDDIQPFLDRYARQSREVREALSANGQSRLDLAYGESAAQTLDLFLPEESAGDAPALHVFIHGGYWQLLDKSDSSFGALAFTRAGAAYAALNYTLAPKANLDEIVEEVRQGIAWLYNNAAALGFARERIYLSGSSAGGHLAAMAMHSDWSEYGLPIDVIKGVCAVSGVFDLEPIRHTYINEPLQLSEAQIEANSPMRLGLTYTCPVLLAYGDNETSEFKRQSRDYAAHLAAAQVDVELREIAHRNHFDVILDLADSNSSLWSSAYRMMGS